MERPRAQSELNSVLCSRRFPSATSRTERNRSQKKKENTNILFWATFGIESVDQLLLLLSHSSNETEHRGLPHFRG
jgi:hypothetical protein